MKAVALALTLFGSLLVVALPTQAQSVPVCDFSGYPQSWSCALPTDTPAPLPIATPIPRLPTAVVPQPSITPTPVPAVATIDGLVGFVMLMSVIERLTKLNTKARVPVLLIAIP